MGGPKEEPPRSYPPARRDAHGDRDESATRAVAEAATSGFGARFRKDPATKTDVAGIRFEPAAIRWAIDPPAAPAFAIGLRVFGLIQAAGSISLHPGRDRHRRGGYSPRPAAGIADQPPRPAPGPAPEEEG